MAHNVVRSVLAVLVAAFVGLSGVAPATAAGPGLRLVELRVAPVGPTGNPVDRWCMSVHPPYSGCGYAMAEITVSGFAAYGGIRDCEADPACDPLQWHADSRGHIAERTTARLTQVYHCGPGTRTRKARSTVQFTSVWNDPSSAASPVSRVDGNTARMRVGAQFPNPRQYSVCPAGATVVVAAWLDEFVVSFDGADPFPDRTWRRGGVVRVPVAA